MILYVVKLKPTLCGLFADIECAKSYAKMAESAKTLASQQVSRFCSLFDLNIPILQQCFSCWGLTFTLPPPHLRTSCLSVRPT